MWEWDMDMWEFVSIGGICVESFFFCLFIELESI